MIEIPVHNMQGDQVDSFRIDEQVLGGELKPVLLKQAYVHFHANRRQGSSATKSRSRVEGSTRKIYKQKGTGNARHGPSGVNLMRGGGHAHSKSPKSWRQKFPNKMRQLANRNALLAKAIDGEIKLVDKLILKKPSTKQFASLLTALQIDRTCLVALMSCSGNEALSAVNIQSTCVTRIDQINAFDLLNSRFFLTEKNLLQHWLTRESQDNALQQDPNA